MKSKLFACFVNLSPVFLIRAFVFLNFNPFIDFLVFIID